jgi:hypothetical protein
MSANVAADPSVEAADLVADADEAAAVAWLGGLVV